MTSSLTLGDASNRVRSGATSHREVSLFPIRRSASVSSWRRSLLDRTTRSASRSSRDRLFITPKTADHHIQHVYTKIEVTTRAAAALWAMQHDLVQ